MAEPEGLQQLKHQPDIQREESVSPERVELSLAMGGKQLWEGCK